MIDSTVKNIVSRVTSEDFLVGNYEVNLFHKACSCRGNYYNGHCKHILEAQKYDKLKPTTTS
jgi:hypothetical protein